MGKNWRHFNELETREKVYYSDGKLNYDSEYFKKFFSSSVQSIVDEVKRVLKSKICSEVEYILKVGEFSESEIVCESIKMAFPEIRVINPEDASLSVLKGGVLFGHDQETVRFRMCPQSYGMHEYFNPKNTICQRVAKLGILSLL